MVKRVDKQKRGGFIAPLEVGGNLGKTLAGCVFF
jgi:hypothetical protein